MPEPTAVPFPRLLTRELEAACADTPVVLVEGPRRAGKSTLVRSALGDGARYLTLDDPSMLDAARFDPKGFVRGLDRAVVDEVQRVPELLLAVKQLVDEDYRPGRFVLTGSANVMAMPRTADSLAGRMQILTLLPLSQCETLRRSSTFLGTLRDDAFTDPRDMILGHALIERLVRGGYPEAFSREETRRRTAWFRSYLRSMLTRDVREVIEIDRVSELPTFVRYAAEMTGNLVNFSDLGASIGVVHKTAASYLRLLENVFLLRLLPSWHLREVKRLVKAPKLHFLDTGILCTLRNLTAERLASHRSTLGAILESFVVSEILKLLHAEEPELAAYHFRDQAAREVDLVLEYPDGTISGVEVKAAAAVGRGDFSGLEALRKVAGERFRNGIVLYDGERCVRFGDRFTAVPLSALWH